MPGRVQGKLKAHVAKNHYVSLRQSMSLGVLWATAPCLTEPLLAVLSNTIKMLLREHMWAGIFAKKSCCQLTRILPPMNHLQDTEREEKFKNVTAAADDDSGRAH
eukprot:1157056-Pelagomonas_calceolata.AAC.3